MVLADYEIAASSTVRKPLIAFGLIVGERFTRRYDMPDDATVSLPVRGGTVDGDGEGLFAPRVENVRTVKSPEPGKIRVEIDFARALPFKTKE